MNTYDEEEMESSSRLVVGTTASDEFKRDPGKYIYPVLVLLAISTAGYLGYLFWAKLQGLDPRTWFRDIKTGKGVGWDLYKWTVPPVAMTDEIVKLGAGSSLHDLFRDPMLLVKKPTKVTEYAIKSGAAVRDLPDIIKVGPGTWTK